jgi:hypothetical protein
MSQETPKQPVPGATIEAPNPQFTQQQRLSYIKITKENNVVLELEAKKHKHIYEALYYKTMTEQLLLEIEASKRAQAPQPQPTDQPVATEGPWEVPANTPSYDAEATTSGSMEELVTPIPESKPIMTVHHTDVDAD